MRQPNTPKRLKPFLLPCLILAAAFTLQAETFKVILDPCDGGSITLSPALPEDGMVEAGTVLKVTTHPSPGKVLDAGYYSIPGRWGAMYHESMKAVFEVVIDQEKHLGASFIAAEEVAHLEVLHDIVYAQPSVKPLKYDVYTPKGAKNLPIIVIIHGGGWVTNDENIMRGLARELTRGGQFVACSIDYRWAGKADGDTHSNTMANLIEDVYGAIAHIMEHAQSYGGDATRIGLTGDSAGGHLSAATSLMVDKIGDGGFGQQSGIFQFKPTYLPEGKTPEAIRDQMLGAIRAAAPSYGVFGGEWLRHYSEDPKADTSWSQAIAPIHHIPQATTRSVPQYLCRGTKDGLIQDAMVSSFAQALVEAGQRVQYVQVGGAGHAFFDWKPNPATKETFHRYGVYYAAEMKAFFASIMH